MEHKEQGVIRTISEVETGTTKDGNEWKKVVFTIANNGGYQGAEQIFAFEIFGAEKVDKFLQHNKEGDLVDVDFNIKTNEWQGKYYTSLSAWKVFKVGANIPNPQPQPQAEPVQEEEGDDLPF